MKRTVPAVASKHNKSRRLNEPSRQPSRGPNEPHKRLNPQSKHQSSLHDLNQLIGQCSRHRKFGEALAAFHKIRTSGKVPNAASYIQIINACSKAGQTNKALLFWQQCQSQLQNLDLQTLSVIYTALIKGYAGELKLSQAYDLMYKFCEGRMPSSRMVDSFLRGTLRVGAVSEALALFQFLAEHSIASLTMTSLSTLIELLVCSGHADQAVKFYQLYAEKLSNGDDDVADFARARCLVMLVIGGRQELLKDAKKALDSLRPKIEEGAQDDRPDTQNLFLKHKFEELQKDFEAFSDVVPKKKLSKVLYLQPGMKNSTASLMAAVGNKHLPGKSCLDFDVRYQSMPRWEDIHSEETPSDEEKLIKKLKKAAKKATEFIVELGCGSGDWICEVAASNPDTLYLANELRWDRALDVVRKRDLKKLENLWVIGGDGTEVLRSVLDPETVTRVHINFPEPPHINDSPDAWLNAEFMKLIHRVLKTKIGEFHLISDQKLFMEYISGALVKPISNGALFQTLTFESPWHFEAVTEYSGSYFDRLWNRGKKTQRFRLALRRQG